MTTNPAFNESSHILANKSQPEPTSSNAAATTTTTTLSTTNVSTISGNPNANVHQSTSSSRASSRPSIQNDITSLVDVERNRMRSASSTTALSDGIFSGGNSTTSLNHIGLNYINSILGSGIVGIPYALHKAGFWVGIMLLISLAVVTDYSLSLLVKSASLAGVTSYQDLVHVAFGRPGFYLLTLLQFIYPFIAMISYNVIIGDTVTKVFKRVFACKY